MEEARIGVHINNTFNTPVLGHPRLISPLHLPVFWILETGSFALLLGFFPPICFSTLSQRW